MVSVELKGHNFFFIGQAEALNELLKTKYTFPYGFQNSLMPGDVKRTNIYVIPFFYIPNIHNPAQLKSN